MAGLAPAVVGITARIGGLGGFVAGIGQMNASMLGFRTSAATAATGLQAATTNFVGFNTAITQLGNSLGAVGQTFNTLTAPIQGLGSVLGSVASTAIGFTTTLVGALGSVAGAFLAVGAAATLGMGAAGVAVATGLGASIPIAAEFHQELVDLGAVAQANPEQIAQVEEAVQRMSRQFAISIPEIQRTALELVKAGTPAEAVANGVLKVTLALQQLSKGELTAEGAGQGIGALLKLFERQFKESGQSVEEFSLRIANAVAAVANNTRATISEVISGVNRLAPTLSARGSDLESVFTSLNIVLSKGIRGEEGGTGLRNLFNFIINPSKEALKVIEELDLKDISPFDVQGNLRPALDILRSIQKVFDEDESTQRLTPADRERAASELFQTRAATIAAIIRQAGPEGITDFQDQLSKTNVLTQASSQLETLTRQFTLLTNAAKLAAITFGQNFLGALTDVGKKANAFLTGDGLLPRVSSAGSAAGAGLFSIITGQNGSSSFEKISQEFGDAAAGAFGNVFNQVDQLREPVQQLVNNLGQLKDTILGIVFPDGPGDAIAKFGELLQGGVTNANRFVSFLNEHLPDMAKNFGTLAQETGSFLDKIGNIVTEGKGLDILPEIWESLQPLISGARDSLDGVATSAASFVQQLVENRDPILGFLEKMVGFFTAIDRLLLGIATNTTRFIGALGAAANFLDTPFRLAREFGAGPLRQGVADRGSFTITTTASRQAEEERRRQEASTIAPATPLSEQARDRDAQITREERALAALSEEQRTSAVQVDAIAQAYAQAATNAEQLSQAGGSALGGTAGAIPPDLVKIAAAAKTAEESAQRMRDRINEAVEDIARQGSQNFRQFERTLQGVDQRFQDTMESLEEQTRDALTNLADAFTNNKKQLEEGFQLRQDEQTVRDQFQVEQEINKRTFDRMLEDRRTLRQQDRENADTGAQRESEDRLRVFQQGLDREDRAHQRSVDNQNRQFERGQEDRLRIFSRNQEDLARRFSQGFETQNIGRQRGQEDTDRQKQFNRDIAKAKTDEERKTIQERFVEETQDLRDRRVRENGELEIRRQQETATLQFRRQQENDVLTFRRGQEEVATERRNNQAEDEVGFRLDLELRFLAQRRLFEDAERERRRLLDARELLTRREEESGEVFNFAQEQRGQQRGLEFDFAKAALDRALQENEQRLNTGLAKLEQQTLRSVNRAERTATRERASALQQYQDQVLNGTSRLADLETDLNRQVIRDINKLKETDPTLSSPKSQEALSQLQGISGALARAQALAGAQGIINGQRAQGAIESTNNAMLGLRGNADSALSGLLSDISQLRELSSGPESGIQITVLTQSPQAERLTQAIIDLTAKIDAIKPGISINTLEQNIESPADAGPAVESVRLIGNAL